MQEIYESTQWFCGYSYVLWFYCRISVAHMDFPKVVEGGLSQMLSLVADHDSDALLDVWYFCADLWFIFELSFLSGHNLCRIMMCRCIWWVGLTISHLKFGHIPPFFPICLIKTLLLRMYLIITVNFCRILIFLWKVEANWEDIPILCVQR